MSRNLDYENGDQMIRASIETDRNPQFFESSTWPHGHEPDSFHDSLSPAKILPSAREAQLRNNSDYDQGDGLNDILVPGFTPDNTVRIIVPRYPRYGPLPYSTSRTGFVYDSAMRFHVDQTEENSDAHPERPGRILQIFDEFVDNGLIPRPLHSDEETIYHLKRIIGREATIEELQLVHTIAHIERVRDSAEASLDRIKEMTTEGEGQASIYWHNLTWLCSKLSAGGAIEATLAVARGLVKNAVAIIRPPGHHAESDEPEGFCFFNNVPIAARSVQRAHPHQYRKILILDWDVHHGNGIQHAFYDDPNVLYISLHVYNGAMFYPHRVDADHTHCGRSAAVGMNVNIPWADQGMKDADYMLAFQQVVMPISQEFDPDLVMISAGFDAADGDPLGACYVSPACYSHMTHMLMSLAGGKVVACLEGGYNLISIAKSALAMTRTLMGEAPERLCGDPNPSSSAVAVVQQVIRTQSAYWKCLYPKQIDLRLREDSVSERLHDVIRDRQSKTLFDNYGMVSLFIRRTGISKSFKDQVLATPNYQENRPLLLLFHDPPQAVDISNRATSNILELHNTFLTDSIQKYVALAVKHEFAVIDVNIPKYITKEIDTVSAVPSQLMKLDSDDERSKMCREIAHYIWENYIELANSEQIFFLGVGEAMLGLTDLLRTEEEWMNKVQAIFNFVGEQPILAVTNPDNDHVSRIYYKRSMVFVAHDHPVWNEGKKPKKRHGGVQRSPHNNLQDMLDDHRDDVFERMLAETEEWRELHQSQTSANATADAQGTDGEMSLELDPQFVVSPAVAALSAAARDVTAVQS